MKPSRNMLLAGLLAAVAVPAGAITPLGGQFRVSLNDTIVEGSAEAAIFDDGTSVVVWEHHHSVSDHDIYARRYLSNGTPISVQTIDADGNDDRRPQIAARPDGGYVIAYVAPGNTLTVKRYNANGSLTGTSTHAALSGTDATLIDLDLAVSSAGVERLYWSVHDPVAGVYRIKVVGESGSPSAGSEIPSAISFLRVRPDDSGNFVLAYLAGTTDSRQVRRDYQGSSGIAVGPSVFQGPNIDIDSDVAPNEFGFDLAAWGAFENAVVFKDVSGAVDGNFIQYSDSGGAKGAPIFLGDDDGTSLAVDCSSSGRCVTGWISRTDGSTGAVRLRETTPAGTVGPLAISPGNSRWLAEQLSLDADHDGDMIVAWTNGNVGFGQDRIVARRYSGSEQVDLQLTQSEAADPVTLPGQISYRINARNLHAKPVAGSPPGIGWATNLQVVDTLPEGTVLANTIGTNWSCTGSSILTCSYGVPLQPQQTAPTLTINVNASSGQTVFNDAYALADQEDPNRDNNAELEQTSLSCGTATFAFASASPSVTENAGTTNVSVVRTGGCGAAAVQVVSNDESASVHSDDYEPVASTLEWANGEFGSKTVLVQINDDAIDEANEKLRLRLVSPVNGTLVVPTEALLTINDNDASPKLRWWTQGQTVNESVDATVAVLKLSMVSGRDVTVNLTPSGTASAASDYQLDSTTVVIPAGWTEIQVPIAIDEDAADEPNETVVLTLASPINAGLADHRTVHTVTIVDNDEPATATVAFTQASGSVGEATSSRNIPVALSAASGQTVTVNYSVTGGNATGGGVDYTLANGTLTFTPGQTSKNIGMSIVNDVIDEGSFETVIVTLSAPSNATLGVATEHSLKILDDD